MNQLPWLCQDDYFLQTHTVHDIYPKSNAGAIPERSNKS